MRYNRIGYNGIRYNTEQESVITLSEQSGIWYNGKRYNGIRYNMKKESSITESGITECGITS